MTTETVISELKSTAGLVFNVRQKLEISRLRMDLIKLTSQVKSLLSGKNFQFSDPNDRISKEQLSYQCNVFLYGNSAVAIVQDDISKSLLTRANSTSPLCSKSYLHSKDYPFMKKIVVEFDLITCVIYTFDNCHSKKDIKEKEISFVHGNSKTKTSIAPKLSPDERSSIAKEIIADKITPCQYLVERSSFDRNFLMEDNAGNAIDKLPHLSHVRNIHHKMHHLNDVEVVEQLYKAQILKEDVFIHAIDHFVSKENGEISIVMAHNGIVEFFRKYENPIDLVHVDITFDLGPLNMTIVCAKASKTFISGVIPIAFNLSSIKASEAYQKLWSVLKKLGLNFEYILTDDEPALTMEFLKQFPDVHLVK